MYSGGTKIDDRKTVGHILTNPVQIEGKTQTVFPQKVILIVVHILSLGVRASRNQVVAH
jgi:hypothetical protein